MPIFLFLGLDAETADAAGRRLLRSLLATSIVIDTSSLERQVRPLEHIQAIPQPPTISLDVPLRQETVPAMTVGQVAFFDPKPSAKKGGAARLMKRHFLNHKPFH